MLFEVQMLKPGYTVTKDVYAQAKDPLIKSGTVLTQVHIDFLKAFLIDRVEVETNQAGRETVRSRRSPFEEKQKETAEKSVSAPQPDSPLDTQYQRAVDSYKKDFQIWQTGSLLDIWSFRKKMIPLIQNALEDAGWMSNFLFSTLPVRSRADRCVTMGLLAAFLEKKMGAPQGDVHQIGLAGMLADAGIAKLPPSLLQREGHFIGNDVSMYERHVLDGYNFLKNTPSLREEFIVAVVQHHELEDGSGYPLHLKSNQINNQGKILAIVDHLLQRMAENPLSGSIIPAIEQLSVLGYRKLSKVYLKKLEVELMTLFIGNSVKLSNGQTGKITFVMDEAPLQPIISLENNQFISLVTHPEIKIVSAG